ncbi:hypothetical protein [Halosimplex pelagicum]|nr:hypothetical protein [Halosimplex pelagicum]
MIDAEVECDDCGTETTTGQHKGDQVLNCADCGKILFRKIGDST